MCILVYAPIFYNETQQIFNFTKVRLQVGVEEYIYFTPFSLSVFIKIYLITLKVILSYFIDLQLLNNGTMEKNSNIGSLIS